jgi:DNA-nicking Smr family endonuclease
MAPIILPIEDHLDLHHFNPKDLPHLMDDYFTACIDKGLYSVRIIHGKGKGILKNRLESILKKHKLVEAFSAAPPEAGGWGATIVKLKRR